MMRTAMVLAVAALVLIIWSASDAYAQAGYFEPLCECRAVVCWYHPVTHPEEWWLAVLFDQIPRWEIAGFWNLEMDWRCSR